MAQHEPGKKMKRRKPSAETAAEPSPSVEALLKDVKILDDRDMRSQGCREWQGIAEQDLAADQENVWHIFEEKSDDIRLPTRRLIQAQPVQKNLKKNETVFAGFSAIARVVGPILK
jgi:hypothetical protein